MVWIALGPLVCLIHSMASTAGRSGSISIASSTSTKHDLPRPSVQLGEGVENGGEHVWYQTTSNEGIWEWEKGIRQVPLPKFTTHKIRKLLTELLSFSLPWGWDTNSPGSPSTAASQACAHGPKGGDEMQTLATGILPTGWMPWPCVMHKNYIRALSPKPILFYHVLGHLEVYLVEGLWDLKLTCVALPWYIEHRHPWSSPSSSGFLERCDRIGLYQLLEHQWSG